MAGYFGDSFDLYAAVADMLLGWWDGGAVSSAQLVTGRFTGSQGFNIPGTAITPFKNSPSNDATHHIVCAHKLTTTFGTNTQGIAIELGDGATVQCSIVFRADGSIILTSGAPAGSVLATYTGAFIAANVWNAYEFEVTINNTTGVFKVRTNGSGSDSFSATALNTRGGTANNYANRLILTAGSGTPTMVIDDLLWNYGATPGTWMGDIRCYTRMPASDASVQFSRTPMTQASPSGSLSTATITTNTARYTPYVASYTGAVSSLAISLALGFTGGLKCAIFAANGTAGAPGTLIQAATAAITNPTAGSNTFSFSPGVSVVRGTTYWVGFCSDTTTTNGWNTNNSVLGDTGTGPVYASWPASNPTGIGTSANVITGNIVITPSINTEFVNETLQDGTTSYVYDSTVGHTDFYAIAALAVTPVSVIAVTTRALMAKSDAGARTAAVQLKSVGTTVASTTLSLSTSFQWIGRTDAVDPATSAAWTPAAVNAATVGPTVIA